MPLNPKIQRAVDLRSKLGDLQKAREEFAKLMQDLDSFDNREKVVLIKEYSNVERDLGNTEKAYELLNKALGYCDEEILKLEVVRLKAYLDLKTGKDPQTIIDDIEVNLKEIDQTRKDEFALEVLANTYALLGNCYANVKMKNWHKAMENYLRALQFAWSVNYNIRIATLLGDMGLVMQYGYRNIPAALGFYSWQEQIAREYNRHAYVAALFRLGRIWDDEDNPERDPEKAKDYYLKSFDIAVKEGWKREQGDALEKLADWYFKQGNTAKALENIDKAIEIFTEIGYFDQLERCKELKKKIEESN